MARYVDGFVPFDGKRMVYGGVQSAGRPLIPSGVSISPSLVRRV
jgi:hypothetical protein